MGALADARELYRATAKHPEQFDSAKMTMTSETFIQQLETWHFGARAEYERTGHWPRLPASLRESASALGTPHLAALDCGHGALTPAGLLINSPTSLALIVPEDWR